jgi:RNA polymerase sigma-70 factor (ECF subfamily)
MSSAESQPDPRELELRALVTSGDFDRATEETLRTYGPELVGWLCAILPSEADAQDAFSRTSEELWKSLRRFDGRCSLRTWCYMLARHAASRSHGAPRKAHEMLVSQIPSIVHATTQIWTTSRITEAQHRDVYAKIRASLDEDDQALLLLRVDRDLQWREIAAILLGERAKPDAITKKAAQLRKQFERVKERLRELAIGRVD